MLACVSSPQPFVIRPAAPADVRDIMRLKLELAVSDDVVHTLQATAADWTRDGFGPCAHFTIFVADWTGHVVGMAICGDRYFPGWVGAAIALLDLCVEEPYRRRGVGTALLGRVAEFAGARNSVMIELTMRTGNPAARFYERLGFTDLTEVRNYVVAGRALESLAKAAANPVAAPALVAG
jgi:ribosomal protein S18 acetylase RimI-like enzyme